MTTSAYLEHLLFWHWWALAVALLVLEALAPGAFFLWMAVAAGAVGVLLLLSPQLSWEIQLLIFSLTSIVAIISWLAWVKTHPAKTAEPTLNRRGVEHIGQQFTLPEPVVQRRGTLQLGDTIWIITGPDCDAGSRIKITAINGSQLQFDIEA
ncbi:MAG: NfeD family protein [Gammaproteobacteria bacterium]|nr:MAG: NfeD family protein [Gammaproteobacteria bacterium]RLA15630.1 MAG: NfeD family protein [Gammaproteobacteria bacterium]